VPALQRTLGEAPRLSRSLAETAAALDGSGRELAGAVDGMSRAAHAIASRDDQLQPLLRNADATLAAIDSDGGRSLGATVAQPSLDLLNDSLLPALHKPTAELGIPSYLSFLNLFEGGGGASRPYQAQPSRIPGMRGGQGHFMRFGLRFLTGVGIPLPPCSLLG